MIPLTRNAFLNDEQTRKELAAFILKTERFSMGEQCAEFERQFAAWQQSCEAVLFNSGGSANLALLQALKNLGRINAGDKIGFSALTWSTNVMPIIQLGMIPVPIDCNPATLNCMAQDLRQRLETEHLRAFFITNALGFSGDLDKIAALCARRNIILLEDNCESLGTVLAGKKAGNFGTAASFSFFISHHMSTIEGGMLCTADQELAEMLHIVRANGWDRDIHAAQQKKWRQRFQILSELDDKYTFYDLGYNLRPTEITGFLGHQQLRYLETNIAIRQQNYLQAEAVTQNNSDLISFDRSHIDFLSSFCIPVLCKTAALRARYIQRFSEAGVEIRPMIAGNIQKHPFYHKYVSNSYPLPGADFVDQCGFYCGNYPDMPEAHRQVISTCLLQE